MARATSVHQPDLLACAVPRRVRVAGPLLMPTVPAAVVGLVVALMVATLGCGEKRPPFPDHLFVPDGAGVISETDLLGPGSRVTLESGETFDVGTGAAQTFESSTSSERGALLIHGVDDGQPWVSLWPRAREIDDGWILYAPAWERPDSFVFLSGMQLPKAPEFQRAEGGRQPSEDGFHVAGMLVANDSGEIILIR